MRLAVAREQRLLRRRYAEPVRGESAEIVAVTGDQLTALIDAAGQDALAPLDVGQRAAQRLHEFALDGRPTDEVVDRVRAVEFGVFRVGGGDGFAQAVRRCRADVLPGGLDATLVRQVARLIDGRELISVQRGYSSSSSSKNSGGFEPTNFSTLSTS